ISASVVAPVLEKSKLGQPAGVAAARVVYSLEKGTTSEMKRILLSVLLLSGVMLAVAQVKNEDLATKNTPSPRADTSATVNGMNIWIYYHAPSVRVATSSIARARSRRMAAYGTS